MNTIVLATDGSPSARKATEVAIELARTTGWDLRIVTAWSMSASSYGYAPIVYPEEFAAEERDRAAAVLETAVATARAAGLDPDPDLREGPAVGMICDSAAECNATLLVIGAHGWGVLKRLLFGSVSTGVLHAAPCPVLVVRAEPVAGDAELADDRAAGTSG